MSCHHAFTKCQTCMGKLYIPSVLKYNVKNRIDGKGTFHQVKSSKKFKELNRFKKIKYNHFFLFKIRPVHLHVCTAVTHVVHPLSE